MKNIVAIIPARGGSKGIPRKNLIDFCGKPLIAWTIENSIKSKCVDRVYVSTDNKEIAGIARRYGAEIVWRPEKIARDTSTSEEAILHAITEIEKVRKIELVVFLQATSPVREWDDIDEAVKTFHLKRADSLFSAAILEDFCAWEISGGRFKSLTYNYKNRGRRQDRKTIYLENGSIYLFRPEVIKKYNNRLGGKIAAHPMPLWRSYEIDTSRDIEICEYYMKAKILRSERRDFLPKNIKLIVYDFDGVLTNNRVVLREDGTESVIVNRADGLAINMIKQIGIRQIILTTETNKVVKARAKKLGIPILMGIKDKKKALLNYCRRLSIPMNEVIYVGNDLNDLGVMKEVGCAACPSDAYEEVKAISKIVLDVPGGSGAVRDLIKYIKNTKRS